MKAKDFDKLVNETIETCKEIMISKGGEYAHGDDRLDNFKRNAQLLGLTPEEVHAIYLGKHMDAIHTYIKDIRSGKERTRSEPILGRFDDAINYLILGKALAVERIKQQEK
jgi:hypothetical protein